MSGTAPATGTFYEYRTTLDSYTGTATTVDGAPTLVVPFRFNPSGAATGGLTESQKYFLAVSTASYPTSASDPTLQTETQSSPWVYMEQWY